MIFVLYIRLFYDPSVRALVSTLILVNFSSVLSFRNETGLPVEGIASPARIRGEELMAPGPKTKRAPQTWASCQKPSTKSNTGGGALASSRGEEMLSALGLGEQRAPSSEGVHPRGQAAKKRLPPRDACEEVLEEHIASVRRRNATVAPEPDASTGDLPPPRSDTEIPGTYAVLYVSQTAHITHVTMMNSEALSSKQKVRI